jgi:hypothetical protein
MHITWSCAGNRVSGFEQLLKCYAVGHSASPRRSTVPLLAYWQRPEQRAEELSGVLGFALSDQIDMDFEHEVPPQRGKGEPSHTDLMVTSGGVSVAIEAKSTEGRYEEVATWLDPATANKTQVLAGWLDLIYGCATTNLEAVDVMDLPYQLIHRAASACHPQVESRWLVYQLLGVSAQEQATYLRDLEALAALMGAGSRLTICVAECSIERSERQIKLERLRDSDERDLGEGLLAGLGAGALQRVELERVDCLSSWPLQRLKAKHAPQ